MSSDSAIVMQVVQRVYKRDSLYEAWVSGIKYGEWPKLDSINVRQRIITERVKETITIQKKRRRWSIGLQAGYGYGFKYRGLEPYVGVGVTYSLFPQ
jgi:opacity protein-like surface antigen